MPYFNKGDLIVGDRRFAGAKLYVDYIRAGLEYITRAHQRLKIKRLTIRRWLGRNDYLVVMPIPKIYSHNDPTLPESIEVRILKVTPIVRERKESFWG